jgi:hypothetical protein
MVSCGTLRVALYPDDEGGEVVVLATVFQAVLTVREDVDEFVAAVIAPGCRPLACAAGVVVGVLATATIAAFEIACRVDDETGVAIPSPTACAAMPTIGSDCSGFGVSDSSEMGGVRDTIDRPALRVQAIVYQEYDKIFIDIL